MSEKVYKLFSGTVKATDTPRTYQWTVSTPAVDRDKDTIALDAWDLRAFRSSPTILWAHDYAGLPIGKAKSIAASGGRLTAEIVFASDVYPFAAQVEKLVAGGYIKSTSVGFRPLPNGATYNKDRGGFDFTAVELLEVSVVPVPSNPQALLEGSSKAFAPMRRWALDVLEKWPDAGQEHVRYHIIGPAPVRVEPKIRLTPEVIKNAVRTELRAEIRRRAGRLD